MTTTTRDQFIETTCDLLEVQGYHGTGISQIIRESGAPKGSLYYHFPGGKEELTAAAILRTGDLIAGRIHQQLDDAVDVIKAIRLFIERVADAVEASEFRAGGPLTAVAMETATSSERLNLACRQAFAQIQQAFGERLTAGGFPAERAAELAVVVTAALEGGIILSRTNHNGDSLRLVAGYVEGLLRAEIASLRMQ